MTAFLKKYLLPIVLGIILTVIIAFWANNERKHITILSFQEMEQNAKIVCDVIRGALCSEIIRGHISTNRFNLVLENIRHSSGLECIRIDIDNKPAVTLPENASIDIDYSSDSGMELTSHNFYYWRTEEIQKFYSCRSRGCMGNYDIPQKASFELNTNLADTR